MKRTTQITILLLTRPNSLVKRTHLFTGQYSVVELHFFNGRMMLHESGRSRDRTARIGNVFIQSFTFFDPQELIHRSNRFRYS